MAHHVFISYASKNKQLADALCHTLEQHRISCWSAPRDVLPGEPYAREIIRGIRDCQIIVLIYTNDSNASEHVLNEIDKAFNDGDITACPELWIEDDGLRFALETDTRVGIGYAAPEDQARLWRWKCGAQEGCT